MRFLSAVSFLTIIKIPKKFLIFKLDKYYELLSFFPTVGLIIGILNFIVFFILSLISHPLLSACFVVIFETILTGGLHLDGLADTFDGFSSKEKDKDKIIEIMKKPNIGVFGVISIIFLIILKIVLTYLIYLRIFNLNSSLLYSIYGHGLNEDFNLIFKNIYIANIISLTNVNITNICFLGLVLTFAPIFGRVSMLYLFSKYDCAVKNKSLVLLFKGENNKKVFLVQSILYSIIFIVLNAFVGFSYNNFLFLENLLILKSLLLIGFVFIFIVITAKVLTKKINGITGDIVGAVSVLTEVCFLFFYYLFINIFINIYKV